ncbi:MAG: extracellular solute-binding protein [Phycisphaeraceae bacterium]|nr:extracellular solute-binding protein [Phycisphaerae bacterium]MBX3392030.1 extracellular solute-binding protein [Phycisphaeraceae bacterium]HRJ49745.1 extracellular solute-binding protein [Phycisphaerales bacterium]
MRPRRSTLAGAVLAVLTAAVVLWPAADAVTGERTLLFTVWGMPFEDLLFRDRYARGFEAAHPGVRVNYQRYADDIIMKYNAWHARGRGADVMRLRITDYHGMAARGMLRRLDMADDGTTRLTDDELAAIPRHLVSLLWTDGPQGHGVYALPQDNAPYGLFYNARIIREHNRLHPDRPVETPSGAWTWDDLRRAARQLTRKDARGNVEIRGIDFAVWSWPFLTFFAQAGGTLWTPDGSDCLIDSPAGVEALEFMRAMSREDGSFIPQLSGYLSGTGPDVLFARGRTALFLDGSWRIADFDRNAPDLEYAVVPLPRGPERLGGRAAVVSGCVLWAVSANAAHPEDGISMVRWLTRAEQAIDYWDTLRVAPPANLSAIGSEAFRSTRGILKDPSDPALGYEVAPMPRERFESRAAWIIQTITPDPLTGTVPAFVPVGRFQTELEEEIVRMLNEYLNESNTKPAHEVLGRAARNVRAIMRRGESDGRIP